jgi:F0F1-type ATP synthase membrane subunit b/b'
VCAAFARPTQTETTRLEIIPDPVHAALLTLPFAVAAIAVYAILWRPLLAYLDERQAVSDHALHEAHDLQHGAEAHLARIDVRLGQARDAVAEQRAAARRRAAVKENEILAAARASADQRVERAVADLKSEQAAASAALKVTANELSNQIAGRVLGRNLT